MPAPLTCNQYDYLEIACLFHYDVCVYKLDGTQVVGTAHTLGMDSNKQERLYLRVLQADATLPQSDTRSVKTSEMIRLKVLTANARFSDIHFD